MNNDHNTNIFYCASDCEQLTVIIHSFMQILEYTFVSFYDNM